MEWNEISIFSAHCDAIITMDLAISAVSPIQSGKQRVKKKERDAATFFALSKFLLLPWLKCSGKQAQVSLVVMLTLFTCTTPICNFTYRTNFQPSYT
jgi:hypothetical protein